MTAMDTRRRDLLRLLGAAPLATFAALAPASAADPGAIWDLRKGVRVGAADLVGALRGARYRLLGEVHDNGIQHDIQRQLLEALGASGLKSAVAFEQFDREHDAALREHLATGRATAESVAEAARLNRRGWNWDFYRPLVETALRHGMPLRAANLSRAEAAAIARRGEGPFDAPWTAEKEQALRALIFDGHCRAMPERIMPGMAAAQRARDRSLADALRDAPADGAVLIAGNGHVRRDLGVPLYLAPGNCVSLGLLEVEAGRDDPRDYAAAYDFAWFTPRAERADPCLPLQPI